MAQVKVKHVVPDYLKTYTVRSGSQAILSKKMQPLQPQEQTTYSPDTNVTTTFALSSNSALFLGQESYFTCRVIFKAENASTGDYSEVTLGRGGFHNLLLSSEIRVLNDGAMVEKVDRYHRTQNILGLFYESADYIDQYGHLYLDHNQLKSERIIPIQTLVISGGAGVIESVNGNTNYTDYLNDENISVFFIVPVGQYTRLCTYDHTNNSLLVNATGVDLADGTYVGAKISVRDMRQTIRWEGAESEPIEVCFQLKSHFLNQTLPLPLMKSGLEVILNWQQAKFAYAANCTDTNITTFSYEIEVPRLQCMLAIPHPDIIQMYAEQWKSPDGIIFHIPQYHCRPYTSSSSGGESETFTIQPGVRAANKVFIAITNQNEAQSQEAQKDIYNYTNIQSLQLRVGTEEFPHKQLYFGVSASQAPYRWKDVFMQTMMAAGVPMNARVRLNFESWAPTMHTDGSETVFCISLTRLKPGEGDDELAGVDLQVVPLEIIIQRFHAFGYSLTGASAGNEFTYSGEAPYYFIVIEHDTYFKYQEQETGLIR